MPAEKDGEAEGRQGLMRRIPAVEALLGRQEVAALEQRFGRRLVVEEVRGFLAALRREAAGGGLRMAELLQRVEGAGEHLRLSLEGRLRFSLRRVINATGVVVHTNLGRAPLAEAAARRVAALASCYSTLEYDLERGERGSRSVHFASLISQLCGAEAATVVNNNAAAMLLALDTLSAGGETVVSRGELVEIGGSFRIPEVMTKSGALLREVGTTNRTRLEDYRQALGDRTRLLLKVHASNFRIVGFTEESTLEELVRLGREHALPVLYDLGSGSLVDLQRFGVQGEPTVAGALAAGADLVTFSGDKLLGGPQAGILVGRREIVSRLDANPLKRALRVDKMTIAALEQVLRDYLAGRAEHEVPALRMIGAPAVELRGRARRLARRIRRRAGEEVVSLEVVPGASRVGGGAAPDLDLPTWLVSLQPRSGSPAHLEERLRRGDPPVITRVRDDRLLLDPRTVLPGEEGELAEALARALGVGSEG